METADRAAKAVLSDTWLKSTRTPNRFISLTSSSPRCLYLSSGHRRGFQLTKDRSILVLEAQRYPLNRRIRCYSHELGSYIGHRACGTFVGLSSISLPEPSGVELTSKGIAKGVSTFISPEPNDIRVSSPLKSKQTGNPSTPNCILDIISGSAQLEIIRVFLNQVD